MSEAQLKFGREDWGEGGKRATVFLELIWPRVATYLLFIIINQYYYYF